MKKESYIIREIEKKDICAYIKYIESIGRESDFLTFGENEVKLSEDQVEKTIEDYSLGKNKLMLVVEYNGEIVANLKFTGGARKRIEHRGEFGVSVKKEFWGRGLASSLIEYMLEWAKESGVINKINLLVREDNHSAIALYKKFGFCIEGRLTREFCVDNIYYNALFMGIEI